MIQDTASTPIGSDHALVPQAPVRVGVAGKRRLARRSSTPLFAPGVSDDLQSQWLEIQTSFVDEPGGSVEQADLLVAEVMRQLAESFAEKRSSLELTLGKGEGVSTEELRVALRRYRSFFDRLLSV